MAQLFSPHICHFYSHLRLSSFLVSPLAFVHITDLVQGLWFKWHWKEAFDCVFTIGFSNHHTALTRYSSSLCITKYRFSESWNSGCCPPLQCCMMCLEIDRAWDWTWSNYLLTDEAAHRRLCCHSVIPSIFPAGEGIIMQLVKRVERADTESSVQQKDQPSTQPLDCQLCH